MSGWIRLERGIVDHWMWEDAEAVKLWLYLLLNANYVDKTRAFNGSVVSVKRGQLIYGRKAVSRKLGIGEAKLRRVMKKFEDDHMISQQRTNKYSIITVTCYEKYQDTNQQTNGQRPANDRLTTTPKQRNKVTKKQPTRFVPPSADDVGEYCKARGNSIDPDSFVDFYTARGWKVGTHTMKDWKACVRTWENRRKEQQPKTTTWELEK